ncbi:ATP-dependent Clp protease ATP-binding subunit ClpC, partial [Nonomuraea sp. NPDC049709]
LEVSPEAKQLLADRGYDPVMGARPLRRTIQRELEDSLSEKILYGDLRPGQIAKVTVDGLGFVFTSESAPSDLRQGVAAPA